jgi:AraC-like DNA-binding protein
MGEAASVAYREFPIRGILADRVVCAWIDRPRPVRQPVMPDACIDLVWDGSTLHVAGPDTQPWPVAGHRTYAGIRFRPGAAPGFLRVSADALLDRRVPLEELWGQAADELAETLAGAPVEAAPAILLRALEYRHADVPPPDPLVLAAVRQAADGLARPDPVEDLAHSLAVSPRTLHRRCTEALGYGPRTLHRIVRFRRALRLATATSGLADLAMEAGYADQAHLSREIRRLAGATPVQIVGGGVVRLSADGLS